MARKNKLTDEIVAAIAKDRHEGGMTGRQVGQKYDLSPPTVLRAEKLFQARTIQPAESMKVTANHKEKLVKDSYQAMSRAVNDQSNVQQAGRLGLDINAKMGEFGMDEVNINVNLNRVMSMIPEGMEEIFIPAREVRLIESQIEEEAQTKNG